MTTIISNKEDLTLLQKTPEVIVTMGEKAKILNDGQVLRAEGVSFGSCVILIVRARNTHRFFVQHVPPGRIIEEGKGLLGWNDEIVVYQSDVTGEISEVYRNGNKYKKEEFIKIFKSRDRSGNYF